MLGAQQAELDLATPPPGVILLAGLQGVGKTTTAAKLARYLHETQKKSVLLVSTDTRRPAAMEQLQRLAEQIGIDCHPADHSAAPADDCRAGADGCAKGGKGCADRGYRRTAGR